MRGKGKLQYFNLVKKCASLLLFEAGENFIGGEGKGLSHPPKNSTSTGRYFFKSRAKSVLRFSSYETEILIMLQKSYTKTRTVILI